MRLIEQVWFNGHPAKFILVPLLLPLTALFWLVSFIRRQLFSVNIKKRITLDKPVIVVGNIGVGGNGKTPVVIHLVELCRSIGLTPGVISRGYGSNAPHYPYLLNAQSTAEQAGDEPLLIFQRCNVPVVIGADRIADGELLIEQGCNIIIADDGLQHYRLARALELIVVDGKRRFGNGLLLPAGPLREGLWRLKPPAKVIINGFNEQTDLPQCLTGAINMSLEAQEVCHLLTNETMTLVDFIRKYPKVNALAGIGDPERFFTTLKQQGFRLDSQIGFVDHHQFSETDLKQFRQDLPLLMTEKDAVKCRSFATEQSWYLPVSAKFNVDEDNKLCADIQRVAKM
ncbi:tetraacyldisaccharide 4'-kinase [Thalassotalea sp. PLHSN55]|uniref:tetraacyldisaccharide 4'-kinase n=1 Tax=Thalassotalea sp. PLHSN55 TaxID=3435888 RepID=UPI003F82C489